MEVIHIHTHPRHFSKLKRGHKVRIVEGEHAIALSPEKHKKVMKAFMKGKGMNIALSPEEIHHNHGKGFFDDIGNTFRSLPQKAQETFQPIAEQSHIPTNLSDLSNIAHIAQIPTDIGGVKRYGKIGLTYGLPALGSALGGAAGSAATLNPLGAIAGATLGGVAGRLAAEQANKQIGDGIGRRRRRGRPSTGGALNSTHMRAGMCGGSVTLDMNGKLIRRFDNFNLKPSMSSTKGNINAVMQPMNGSGWFDKALDTSFTPRQAIQLAKNVPGLAKEAGRDIEGAGVKAKRFVKGSAEAKAHMAKIRGMKK